MFELDQEKKFEALKLRYTDHVELLRTMTKLDLEIFGGYITLQLALGSWLSQNYPKHLWGKLGILLIDLALSVIAFVLLRNSAKRRVEAVETLMNIQSALGYDRVGVYLPDKAINADYTYRPWKHWFYLGIAAGFAGIIILLFVPLK